MAFLLPYLLLFALGLAVAASLVVVVMSALALVSGGPRSGETRSRPASPAPYTTPMVPEPMNRRPAETSLLEDGHWMKLVEECVEVVNELDDHMSNFDAPRREVARHVILRLEEVLGRSGVEIIENDASFDRARHQQTPASAVTAPGAPISETLSPGFAVGPRVLRRARVRVE